MELLPIARKIGAIALIGLVSEFAFSGNKKNQIRKRDNYQSVRVIRISVSIIDV